MVMSSQSQGKKANDSPNMKRTPTPLKTPEVQQPPPPANHHRDKSKQCAYKLQQQDWGGHAQTLTINGVIATKDTSVTDENADHA